jgi:hypothetical protein
LNAYTLDMQYFRSLRRLCTWMLLGLSVMTAVSGCAVVAVADLAVTTVSTVVSTGVKATGAVIDAVIPDSSPKK